MKNKTKYTLVYNLSTLAANYRWRIKADHDFDRVIKGVAKFILELKKMAKDNYVARNVLNNVDFKFDKKRYTMKGYMVYMNKKVCLLASIMDYLDDLAYDFEDDVSSISEDDVYYLNRQIEICEKILGVKKFTLNEIQNGINQEIR